MTDQNEARLVKRAKQGDMHAFEELILQHEKIVYNVALRMMNHSEDAKDISQEVFLKAYRNIGNFDERSQFSTWIYRITANTCIDEMRKRKGRQSFSLEEELESEEGSMQRQVADAGETPEESMLREEQKSEILPLRIGKNPDDFYSMFEVVIQLGAILAVVVLFWSQIWPFGRKNNKAPLAKTGIGAWVKTDIFVLWFHILVSTVPAAIIGILFDDVFERLFYNFQTVAIMLILFGIAFIVIETRHNGKSAKINSLVDISYTTALMIGFFQLIAAVFPGTSRSGATIVGALLIGVSRTVAAEYTFFLAIPVMFGASLLKLVKFGFHFTGEEAAILIIGMIVAFVVSLIVIKFLMGYIKKHNFIVFGWYRIVLGAIVLLCGIAGLL